MTIPKCCRTASASTLLLLLLLVLLAALPARLRAAQLVADPAQSELQYMLTEKDHQEAVRQDLVSQMAALQKKIAEDRFADIRARATKLEEYAAGLREQRAHAPAEGDPELVRSTEWPARDAMEKAAGLRRDLAARQKAEVPAIEALKRQVEAKQKELDSNARLRETLGGEIARLQADHRRQTTMEEISEVPTGPGAAAQAGPPAAGGVIVTPPSGVK